MLRPPERISFRRLLEPFSREECLIIYKRDIPDARGPAWSPSRCYVVGFSPASGNHYKFTALIEDYRKAPVSHFIEVDNLQAPAGCLVDPAGQPFDPLVLERRS